MISEVFAVILSNPINCAFDELLFSEKFFFFFIVPLVINSSEELSISSKLGLSSFIFKFAHNFSFIYGLFSAIIAISLGLSAGLIFRKYL